MEISVLIVGAGPTGLALACDLARRGTSFRIIDKAPAYFAGSRGKGLQPRTLEVLDDFGVIDEVLASGRFHLPFRGYEGTKVLGDYDLHEGRHPTPDIPYASSLIIPQWRVEEILRNLLGRFDGYVDLGTELIDFEQTVDSVTAVLANPYKTEQLTVRYMVGCDGGRSFVRRKLGVGFAGETWNSERMLIGDVQADGLDRDHWHSWINNENGWLGLCPLPGTKSFQLQAQIAVDEPDEPSLERLQEIVNKRTGRDDIRLHDATWLSFFRANVRMVDRYRVGSIFLAGDAAHVHSPAGGQGMNTGIQDAYNLGWKLAQTLTGAESELLDTYQEERLPVAAAMLGLTSKLHRETLGGNVKPPPRSAEMLQLGINYRGSSLSKEKRDVPRTIRAGDRAPDAPCCGASGAKVRLFEVFRGHHFTVLYFGPEPNAEITEMAGRFGALLRAYTVIRRDAPLASSGHGEVLYDTEGHAYRAWDTESSTLFLVRPDGYIGLVTKTQLVESINEYLGQVGQILGRL